MLLGAGRIGRPHGLDGSFHVVQPRPRLLLLGMHVHVAGGVFEVVRRAGTDERPILRLRGHDTREAAEALRGQELRVPREETPPIAEDEWLAEDLEGLRVLDGAREVGVVKRMLAYPSCDLLEVERAGGGADLLVPLISDAVRDVDVAGGTVDVNLAFLGEDAE